MRSMTSRERVQRMMNFEAVDIPVLSVDISERGLYDHGEKLRDLLKTIEGDFGPISSVPIPVPPPQAIDEQGNYLWYETDAWGVTWESRIFKMVGHPYRRPLDDWEALPTYKMPPNMFPAPGTPEYEPLYSSCQQLSRRYYRLYGWVSILEKMIALRKFEDVLEDIYEDTPEINRLADMLTEYAAQDIRNILSLNPDGVRFADDFGAQNSMLISPEMYRHFFKPRFAKLIRMVKDAGKKVFMHCCGYALPIFEDYREMGVDEIWTQISVYNQTELADYCRQNKLVLAIHPDRANLMTHGTPQEIQEQMQRYMDIYRPLEGGSYFYIEIDNDFPYENIVALAEFLQKVRQ